MENKKEVPRYVDSDELKDELNRREEDEQLDDYVCFSCGNEFLTDKQLKERSEEGHVVTARKHECCVCKEEKLTVHRCNFNWLIKPKE